MSALHGAVALVVAETTVEVAVVLASDRWPIPGRVLLALCVGLQYLFAWRLLHRSAGAFLGLLLWQLSALLVAAGADWAVAARAALAATAVTTVVLLVRASRTFPEPALPT